MKFALGIMKKVTISKEEIAILEKVSYKGAIHIIDSTAQARAAVAHLRKFKIVGFDTETRPSFKKGVLRNMALMQISTLEDCFLFRLNMIGIPDSLREFLEDAEISKVGLSLKDDFNVLHRSFDALSPNGFIELQNLVEEYEIVDKSLQKIYAVLFNKKISKGQRLSNWEASELSYAQQEYAAIDALSCLEIYNHLKSGEFKPTESQYYKEIIEQTDIIANNETI